VFYPVGTPVVPVVLHTTAVVPDAATSNEFYKSNGINYAVMFAIF